MNGKLQGNGQNSNNANHSAEQQEKTKKLSSRDVVIGCVVLIIVIWVIKSCIFPTELRPDNNILTPTSITETLTPYCEDIDENIYYAYMANESGIKRGPDHPNVIYSTVTPDPNIPTQSTLVGQCFQVVGESNTQQKWYQILYQSGQLAWVAASNIDLITPSTEVNLPIVSPPATFTNTATVTPSPTDTYTPTPTPSITLTSSITPTLSPTITSSPTITITPSLTVTPSRTSTHTTTPTHTYTPTPSPSPTPTSTFTPTPVPLTLDATGGFTMDDDGSRQFSVDVPAHGFIYLEAQTDDANIIVTIEDNKGIIEGPTSRPRLYQWLQSFDQDTHLIITVDMPAESEINIVVYDLVNHRGQLFDGQRESGELIISHSITGYASDVRAEHWTFRGEENRQAVIEVNVDIQDSGFPFNPTILLIAPDGSIMLSETHVPSQRGNYVRTVTLPQLGDYALIISYDEGSSTPPRTGIYNVLFRLLD